MTLRKINDNKEPVLCPSCGGWGVVEVSLIEVGHRSTLRYVDTPCLFCYGRGVMLKDVKLEPIIQQAMNEDLTLIPEGVDVQLKVTVKKHNNEVWTIGKKLNGKIEVVGFRNDECIVKGFRLLDE